MPSAVGLTVADLMRLPWGFDETALDVGVHTKVASFSEFDRVRADA